MLWTKSAISSTLASPVSYTHLTAYLHFTNKRIPAFNHILFHINLFMYAGLAQQQRAHRHTDHGLY